jgi:tetratricopeptide (TPR) repeat protein
LTDAHAPPARRLSAGRLLAFSLLLPLLLLAAAELVLRAAGVEPTPDRTNTWFADHVLSPPLWHDATTAAGVRMMTSGQAHHFHPFTAEKLPDTFRVAVLGGSAAHGYGVLEPGAFPHRLEQILQQALPTQDVQVINLGTVAWSSQQLLWASKEIWGVSEWDLLIIYSGNNELLELSSWKTFLPAGEHLRYTQTLLANQRLGDLRIYAALHRAFAKEQPDELRDTGNEPPPQTGEGHDPTSEDAPMVGGEEEAEGLEIGVDPIQRIPAMNVDSMQALPKTERARMGDVELRYAARTYTHNVGRIVDLAQENSTQVVVMNPAANDFQDPAYFPHGGEEGERFNALMKTAMDVLREGHADDMFAAVDAALALRPEDPLALFSKAQALAMSGRHEEARTLYDLARSRAEYPNRVVPAVTEAILSFEGRSGVLGVLDAEALFRDQSDGGLIGYDLVYDHCHPSVQANYLIAAQVATFLLASDLPQVQDAVDVDIDAWAARGRETIERRTAADPRLWEWTGLDYEGKRSGGKYIADFQGDWRILREDLFEAAAAEGATAMDLLWGGNAAYYGYEVDRALHYWERALGADPELCLAHANRAHALRMMGQREQALGDAEKAVLCAPNDDEYQAMRDLLAALQGAQ